MREKERFQNSRNYIPSCRESNNGQSRVNNRPAFFSEIPYFVDSFDAGIFKVSSAINFQS